MADRLPLEILSQIAEYIHEEVEEAEEEADPVLHKAARASLEKAAAVSGKWKAAFDPFLYKTFDLQCTNTYPWGLHKSNLSVFKARTSGPLGVPRRNVIRNVSYYIKIAYKAPKRPTDHKIGSIQKANEYAYRSAVAGLFEVLRTWDNSCRLTLGLHLAYGSRPKQPSPTESNNSQNYFESIGTTIAIPDVHCINTLYLESNEHVEDGRELYSVSTKTLLEVAHHCTTLKELYVSPRTASFPDWEPRDHNEEQRHDIAIGLCDLPSSLQTLRFMEENIAAVGFPLVLSRNDNLFTANLRSMSVHLRHLELSRARLPPDFLVPLDESHKPIQDSLHWPRLELVQIHQAPTFTHAGELELEEDNILSESTSPDPKDKALYNRAFISTAYAVRQMPRLATFMYTTIDHYIFQGLPDHYSIFKFKNDRATRTVTAQWISITGYKPGKRVANAWGFRLSDMTVRYDGPKATSRIELSAWPPTKTWY